MAPSNCEATFGTLHARRYRFVLSRRLDDVASHSARDVTDASALGWC